jgi:predicted nucleic acid-binding protein
VDAWARSVPSDQDFLSVVVVGELGRGIALKRRSDPVAAASLEQWFARLKQLYSERILPVTLEVAETWGNLGAVRSIGAEDGLIAATALVHGLTLVTRNTRDVEGLGVSLLNPWQ